MTGLRILIGEGYFAALTYLISEKIYTEGKGQQEYVSGPAEIDF